MNVVVECQERELTRSCGRGLWGLFAGIFVLIMFGGLGLLGLCNNIGTWNARKSAKRGESKLTHAFNKTMRLDYFSITAQASSLRKFPSFHHPDADPS